ncbi:glycosyltransferase family 61 protein [Cognataquiflexum aquatile]|uniref:glycosyltransferase family 61 protein n=1 Tax=Cognataquiflexum aquatile TaxID=2249427 RepID=UPI000DEA53C9|nr:glycosyltransferase family 61 protein [Cognataquiflexum aquatile]
MKKIVVLNERIIDRGAPKNFKPQDDHLFKRYWKTVAPECHLWIIEKPLVIRDSIFYPKNFKFFDRYTHYNGISFLGKLMRVFFWVTKKKVSLGKSVWIHDNFSGNYFHWFAECLPRLLFSESFQNGHIVILPKNLSKFTFVKESLDLMGAKYEFFDKNQNYEISELILTNRIGRISEFRKELLFKVKAKFDFLGSNIAPKRKIYIRRKPAKARNILNEEAVLKVLSDHHVESLYLDDFNLMDEIRLLDETCLLISIHGAGLTNMLFMQGSGNVLEFRNEEDGGASTNSFFNLASELGINYYYLTNKTTSHKTNHADFEINVEKLNDILTTFDLTLKKA